MSLKTRVVWSNLFKNVLYGVIFAIPVSPFLSAATPLWTLSIHSWSLSSKLRRNELIEFAFNTTDWFPRLVQIVEPFFLFSILKVNYCISIYRISKILQNTYKWPLSSNSLYASKSFGNSDLILSWLMWVARSVLNKLQVRLATDFSLKIK